MNKDIGIYKITNLINNKCYVGSSSNLNRRENDHFRLLKQGKSHSLLLQRAVNKYGIDNFKFEILDYCEESVIYKVEQEFVNNIKPEYNQCLEVVTCPKGYRHTDEAKIKISEARKKSIDTVLLSKQAIERHKTNDKFGYKKKIQKLDSKENVIKEYNSLKEYAIEHNCSIVAVSKALSKGHKCKGFKIRSKP